MLTICSRILYRVLYKLRHFFPNIAMLWHHNNVTGQFVQTVLNNTNTGISDTPLETLNLVISLKRSSSSHVVAACGPCSSALFAEW